MSHFGGLLKEARLRARLTQKELGEKVSVDDSYISKIEAGVNSPPKGVILELLEALGIIKKSRRWQEFLLAAGVASAEDMEGFALIEVAGAEPLGGMQPALAGALGSGVGLDEMLSRDQQLELLVEQIVDEFQLTPEKRRLAERLIRPILENAYYVCEVLTKEQD